MMQLGFGLGLTMQQSGGGGAILPYTARFGVGVDNGSGTGAFNTALYSGAPPADGTYGAFTVASGVITPSGAQTAGTYDVGGWPVQVISGYKAIANTAQFYAITGADAGKTFLIRETANISVSYDWNRNVDFNWATVLGDGLDYRSAYLDPTKDSRNHFKSIILETVKKLVFYKLNIVTGSVVGAKFTPFEIQHGGLGPSQDITVERCRIIASRPVVGGDYSGGLTSFPGQGGLVATASNSRISFIDNVIFGGAAGDGAMRLGSLDWQELIGNVVDMFYGDGVRPSGSGPMMLGANLLLRPMATDTDAGNYHPDALQLLTATGVVEASAFVTGQGRGVWQSMFQKDGPGKLHYRDCVIVDNSLFQATIGQSAGSRMENMVWFPMASQTVPIGSTTLGGIRFQDSGGGISGANDVKNSVYRVSKSLIDGSVSTSGIVDSSSWDAAAYTAAFPDWYFSVSYVPTLQEMLAVIGKPASGGAAAGKGPRVTFSGAERSSYVLAVPAPTLSSLVITPTETGFSGTVQTDTDLQAIWWAVIPTAAGTPTAREIKTRRISGALGYGDVWVNAGQTATNIALALASGLSASTGYKLAIYQDNGWSVQSAVTVSAFTTAAATGITHIASGAIVGTNSGNSLSVAIPTNIAGDMLVCVVNHEHTTGVPTTPSGWVLSGDGVGFSSGNMEIAVFTKISSGSEGATLALSFSSTSKYCAGMFSLRNAVGTGGFATAATFSATTRDSPTITASTSAVIHAWVSGAGSSHTLTTPTAPDVVLNGGNPDGSRQLAVELQRNFAGGTTAARTATCGASVTWCAVQLEITD